MRIVFAEPLGFRQGALEAGNVRRKGCGAFIEAVRVVQTAQNPVCVAGAEIGPCIIGIESQELLKSLQRFGRTNEHIQRIAEIVEDGWAVRLFLERLPVMLDSFFMTVQRRQSDTQIVLC